MKYINKYTYMSANNERPDASWAIFFVIYLLKLLCKWAGCNDKLADSPFK